MPCSACALGSLWGLVAPHVFASMTTVRTDTNAVTTSSRVAAAIAPMLSVVEDVLAVASTGSLTRRRFA